MDKKIVVALVIVVVVLAGIIAYYFFIPTATGVGCGRANGSIAPVGSTQGCARCEAIVGGNGYAWTTDNSLCPAGTECTSIDSSTGVGKCS
jgi:hypothetical protein